MKTISIGGMGGFELGMSAAMSGPGAGDGALHAVAFCEVERRAKEVLRRHWPEAHTYSSVWDIVNSTSYERRSIDVICGKFGSGDVHVAGRAERVVPGAGRFEGYARLMRALQPEHGIVEFESGILQRDRGRRFQAVLAHLTGWVPTIPVDGWRSFGLATPAPGLGDDAFGVAWRLLDLRGFSSPSLHYGVPVTMCRERLYLVSQRGGATRPEVLLDEDDVRRLHAEVAGEKPPEWDKDRCSSTPIVAFDGRSAGHNASPLIPRATLPTIHGQNVAIAYLDGRVRWTTPEECELAFTLPLGHTATGRRVTTKMNKDVAISDAPRYRMIGRHTVPPAIIEWIASRLFDTNFHTNS